jgi:hypothetical protein
MNAESAANRLDQRLRGHPWYMSVGVGSTSDGEQIFVYVKSLRHRELNQLQLQDGWMGYPVKVRAVGTVSAGAVAG